MQHEIFKLCADSLRTFSKEKYDIKLKASHAHELVAAYFGYKSKNAMLVDRKYPISNLNQAEIIVSTSDEFIDQRRRNLQELSTELPDSYTLGEAVYAPLFAGEWLTSPYPPFRNFKVLAKFLVENSDSYQQAFRFYQDVPMEHFVEVKNGDNEVQLTVIHSHRESTGEFIDNGDTTIKLPRVAGCIGYGKPQLSVVRRTAGARRKLQFLGVQT